ncbi:MAG: DUF2304 domain-containing protein [Candidatus Sericytochromatia bacterium]|nr:DUF2304 domain-containing protein [Candidatus Tanganyikabacteria bacterium]
MHTLKIQLLGIVGSLALLLLIFELLRKRKLREEYALLWLAGGAACLALAVFRDGMKWFAQALGIYYPPAAILLVLLAGAYLMLLHFSLVFSQQAERTKRLTQEVGLLKLEVERLRVAGPTDQVQEAADR